MRAGRKGCFKMDCAPPFSGVDDSESCAVFYWWVESHKNLLQRKVFLDGFEQDWKVDWHGEELSKISRNRRCFEIWSIYRPSLKSHEDEFSLSIQVVCSTFHIKQSCSKMIGLAHVYSTWFEFSCKVSQKINTISTLEHYNYIYIIIRVYLVTSREFSERILSGRAPKGHNSRIIFVL